MNPLNDPLRRLWITTRELIDEAAQQENVDGDLLFTSVTSLRKLRGSAIRMGNARWVLVEQQPDVVDDIRTCVLGIRLELTPTAIADWWSQDPDVARSYMNVGVSSADRIRWLRLGFMTAADVRGALLAGAVLESLEAEFMAGRTQRQEDAELRSATQRRAIKSAHTRNMYAGSGQGRIDRSLAFGFDDAGCSRCRAARFAGSTLDIEEFTREGVTHRHLVQP